MEEPSAFDVDVSEYCVKVSGEVDSLTAPKMVDAMLGSSLAKLDLSGVSFMDSSGIHALGRLRDEREGFRIVAASRAVRRLLDITGMSEYLMGDNGNGATG